MNYDLNNIFAKILRGEMPCHRVYEDEHTLAFMDVMPRTTGHTLIVPKSPCRNVLDAKPEVLAHLIQVAQKIGRAAINAFGADGLTIQQFNESAGGQVIFHLHFHVLPRWEGEALRPHSGQMEKPDILAENAKKLVAAL